MSDDFFLLNGPLGDQEQDQNRNSDNNKGMPAHKIGRLWKFKKDEVDEWVREGKAGEVNNRN